MSVAEALDEGCGTVGTKLELEHTAPTPVGMTVTCESELVAVEGRKLVFKVSLHDEKGPVGGGTHERFCHQQRQVCGQGREQKELNLSVELRSPATPLSALSCHLPRPGESFLTGEPLANRSTFIRLPRPPLDRGGGIA